MNKELTKNQSRLARKRMESNDPAGILKYHNWAHVKKVIASATILSEKAKLNAESSENLVLAAIWHDVDYANGTEGHEERAGQIAGVQLQELGLGKKRVAEVQSLILATKMGHVPTNSLERLIKDADLSHVGGTEYFDFYDLLYQELKVTDKKELNPSAWKELCIQFLDRHEFHSQEAKSLWNEGKNQNIQLLKSIIMETKSNETSERALSKAERKAIKELRKKSEPKFNTEKGIETMFRVSLRNHINLSRIADDKANTLISVNAIILSIVLSALFPKMDSNPWLIYPGMALILVSISTIILSTLSTIPKTTHGTVSVDDVKNKKGNLLFFGNFHKMSLAEYEFGIGELMKDGAYLYGTLTRDLYFLGKVLERKYGLLRRAYVVFVVGLVISIALFAWSILSLTPPITPPVPTEAL